MNTCSNESREEALKVYTTIFENAHDTAGRIYLNPLTDTLITYVSSSSSLFVHFILRHCIDVKNRLSLFAFGPTSLTNSYDQIIGSGPWDENEHLEVLLADPEHAALGKFSAGKGCKAVMFRARRATESKELSLNSMHAKSESVHGARSFDRNRQRLPLWEAKRWDAIWQLLADYMC